MTQEYIKEESKSTTRSKTRAVTRFSEEYFIPPSKKAGYLLKAMDLNFTKNLMQKQQDLEQ